MALPVEIGSALASGALGLGNTLLSGVIGRSNMNKQVEQSKELMDYQWDKFQSPQAQVSALAKAGLNPLVAFGKGGSQLATPSPSSVSSPSYAPVDLSLGLGVLGNYIKSVADAKKAGMDTKLSEQEIKNKQVEESRNKFQFELEQEFGRHDWTSKIANEYMKLILASDSSDLNEQEKALNDYRLAISDLEKQIKGDERQIVAQKLENNPTAIALENRIKESQAEANEASAQLDYANILVSREIQRQESVKTDVLQSGKKDQIKALIDGYRRDRMISHKDYQEALRMYNDILIRNDRRGNSNFVNKVDALFNWLGDILGTPLKGLK